MADDETLTDEQVAAALGNAAATPEQLLALMNMMALEATGDPVADVRRLALALDIELISLLYGLTSEDSPLFQDYDDGGFWG